MPGTVAEVFAFFKNPYNLEAITPPWLGFRIISTTDHEVREGTRIRYRLRLHGIPLTWESVIAEYRENEMFADRQVTGPYRHWYHRHRFREEGGGVAIEDEVDYQLPLGVLGRVVHSLVVRRQLETIFGFRAAAVPGRLAGYIQP